MKLSEPWLLFGSSLDIAAFTSLSVASVTRALFCSGLITGSKVQDTFLNHFHHVVFVANIFHYHILQNYVESLLG